MKAIIILKGLMIQYINEVLTILWALFTWIDFDNIIINILWTFISSVCIYFFLNLVKDIYYIFHKPKDCKILHIRKNGIYMIPKKIKQKDGFIDEFNKIIDYAKNQGYANVQIHTHQLILYGLLNMYIENNKGIINDCLRMKIGEEKEIQSIIGKFIIIRESDGINICARYENFSIGNNKSIWMRIINRIKRFKKTFRFYQKYYIIIEFSNKANKKK